MRELIDPRCWRAAQFAAAVRAEIPITDIVRQNEHHIGFLLLGLSGSQ